MQETLPQLKYNPNTSLKFTKKFRNEQRPTFDCYSFEAEIKYNQTSLMLMFIIENTRNNTSTGYSTNFYITVKNLEDQHTDHPLAPVGWINHFSKKCKSFRLEIFEYNPYTNLKKNMHDKYRVVNPYDPGILTCSGNLLDLDKNITFKNLLYVLGIYVTINDELKSFIINCIAFAQAPIEITDSQTVSSRAWKFDEDLNSTCIEKFDYIKRHANYNRVFGSCQTYQTIFKFQDQTIELIFIIEQSCLPNGNNNYCFYFEAYNLDQSNKRKGISYGAIECILFHCRKNNIKIERPSPLTLNACKFDISNIKDFSPMMSIIKSIAIIPEEMGKYLNEVFKASNSSLSEIPTIVNQTGQMLFAPPPSSSQTRNQEEKPLLREESNKSCCNIL